MNRKGVGMWKQNRRERFAPPLADRGYIALTIIVPNTIAMMNR
jgi:hypothetical protein